MSKFRYFSRFERLEREEILPPLSRPLSTTSEEKGRSPASQKIGLTKPPLAVMDRLTDGPKLASRASALREIERKLETYTEQDFADPSKRKAYRTLRNAQLALEASPRNVTARPGGIAKVYSGPLGREWPITTSGTAARYSAWTSVAGRPQLQRKSLLLPCVERYVRQQVLFAKGLAGKGYRTPHRKNKNSWIPC